MTDALLLEERVRRAVSLGESQFREFKSALEGSPADKKPRPVKDIRQDIARTLVAFANADGGELLIGVEDDGDVTGVPHSPAHVQTLLDAPVSGVDASTPLPSVSARRLTVDGKEVLYFAVTKGTEKIHFTADGRCIQRRDRESVPVTAEKVEFERREQLSRGYDRQFVDGATVADLDQDLLRAVGSTIAPTLSIEKLLQLLNLAEFDGVTVRLRRAALLLFASDVGRWHPRCQVRILRVAGNELLTGREYNVERDETVTGNLWQLLEQAWTRLRPYLTQTRLSSSGLFEQQVAYPEDACREALVNAIAHRDYSDEGAGIEVYVFNDRLTVRSPGALLSTLTIEDLKAERGAHESRNAFLARVLREGGFMRELGEGVRRIFRLMRENDLVEPELDVTLSSFTLVLRHQTIFSTADQRWLQGYDAFALSPDEMKVVLLGQRETLFSMQEVWDLLEIVDVDDWRGLLQGLQEKGVVVTEVPKSRADLLALRQGIPKRSVPRFRVRDAETCRRDLGQLQVALADKRRPTLLELRAAFAGLADVNAYRRTQHHATTAMALGLIDEVTPGGDGRPSPSGTVTAPGQRRRARNQGRRGPTGSGAN